MALEVMELEGRWKGGVLFGDPSTLRIGRTQKLRELELTGAACRTTGSLMMAL